MVLIPLCRVISTAVQCTLADVVRRRLQKNGARVFMRASYLSKPLNKTAKAIARYGDLGKVSVLAWASSSATWPAGSPFFERI